MEQYKLRVLVCPWKLLLGTAPVVENINFFCLFSLTKNIYFRYVRFWVVGSVCRTSVSASSVVTSESNKTKKNQKDR